MKTFKKPNATEGGAFFAGSNNKPKPTNTSASASSDNGSQKSLRTTIACLADPSNSMLASSSSVNIGTSQTSKEETSTMASFTENPASGGKVVQNPFTPGEVYFSNFPLNILNTIRVIPEDAKSSSDLIRPVNGKWYDTDGLWIEGYKDKWYKIPDHVSSTVTYNAATKRYEFEHSIHWVTSWFKEGPRWVPDSGDTEHVTNYPF